MQGRKNPEGGKTLKEEKPCKEGNFARKKILAWRKNLEEGKPCKLGNFARRKIL